MRWFRCHLSMFARLALAAWIGVLVIGALHGCIAATSHRVTLSQHAAMSPSSDDAHAKPADACQRQCADASAATPRSNDNVTLLDYPAVAAPLLLLPILLFLFFDGSPIGPFVPRPVPLPLLPARLRFVRLNN